MNTPLLTKWWLRFFNEMSLLWNKLVRTLYYTKRRPLHESRTFVPYSQWWRGVLFCRDIFKCSISNDLGSGSDIRLWLDIWIGETPLRTLYPDIFDYVRNKEARVDQCWKPNGWRWRYIGRGDRGPPQWSAADN